MTLASPAYALEPFSDWEALVADAAGRIAFALDEAVRERGHAMMALSGGSTPADLYRALARRSLPWRQVTATLVDERWADADGPDSNARLVRETLLQDEAGVAAFLPLKTDEASTPAEAALQASRALATAGLPLDVVLLGMGADGHFASLFPGSPALWPAFERDAPICIAVPAGEPAPPQPRLSLTLPVLLTARRSWLVVRGEEKLEVLAQAARQEEQEGAPITTLLRRSHAPLPVLWAP